MNSAKTPNYRPENFEGRSSEERRKLLRKAKTRKVNKRLSKPPRFHPRPRHYQILEWLLQYRLLTARHFELLLGRHRGSVQPVLRTLYDHGWLDRIMRPIIPGVGDTPHIIYRLGKQGMVELQRRGFSDFSSVPDKRLSLLFLEHSLDINTFAINFFKACERHSYRVSSWLDERMLKTPGNYDRVFVDELGAQAAVIADSYYRITSPAGLTFRFFLELDEGSESLTRIKRKVAAWRSYYQSGGMKERFGSHGRVLFVTPHRRRLENLIRAAETVSGIGRRFWFAHLDEISPERMFFDPVWQVANKEDSEGERRASLFEP